MSRPARVIIRESALLHNIQHIRNLVAQSRIIAIVKAEAYGHGLIRVAHCLEDHVDAFGVTCLEEASILRSRNIQKPIILLEGIYHRDEMESIIDLHLDMVVHQMWQLQVLKAHPKGRQCQLWLKFDTGMHRLGFAIDQLSEVLKICEQIKLDKTPRLMSHFSVASEPEHPLNTTQKECFERLSAATTNMETSLPNSAAVLHGEKNYDWVRPGLALYGISPFTHTTGSSHGLQPVMTLESELIAIQQLQPGENVGYGACWQTPVAMPIGIVAIGYADGYPRHAPTGTPVLVKDTPCSLVGRVSMDMLAVDLRQCCNAQVGDRVLLWGEPLPVERIAQAANTIPYDLVCGIHKRLKFISR